MARYNQGSSRGTLVGEPSGASNSLLYGGFTQQFIIGQQEEFILALKNWRIRPTYATAGILTPDLYVPITAEDIALDRDAQLQATLDFLR